MSRALRRLPHCDSLDLTSPPRPQFAAATFAPIYLFIGNINKLPLQQVLHSSHLTTSCAGNVEAAGEPDSSSLSLFANKDGGF